MRVNMGREGRTSSSLSANGGTMLGSLILANGPSQPLEAATKYYVDTAFANLNANNVVDGVLPISSLPGFTGDATSNQGSNIITLANLGVNPGSYAKVIVDSKGRVTGNDVLLSSDLPVVNWSKIQNEPTTVEGYGITDALTTAGGTFTGNLSVGFPKQSLSAVNKQYVDSALTGNSAVVGDIIRKPYASTPVGFLRCNGGLVDKTTYSNLYAVIGDNFANNSVKGSGKPWTQQYQINTIQSADITGWANDTALPGALYASAVIVTKNRVYFCGGTNGTNYVTTVYTAPINADGTLGTWTTGTALPGIFGLSQSIVTKNRVYLLGGETASSVASTIIYTAVINADGTLGGWSTAGGLPGPLAIPQAIVTKNRVYLLGGTNASVYSVTVYTAVINSDGSIGTWTTGGSLPAALGFSQAVVTKNRVYLLGGRNATTHFSTVYTAPINTDGTLGGWSTAGELPGPLAMSQAIVTKNRVYLLGGATASGTYVSTVYSAPINIDGTLGTWVTGTSLPSNLSISQTIVTKNRIYMLGGWNGTAAQSTVYSATFYGGENDYSAYYEPAIEFNYMMPGSGKPWQQQYQINQTQSNDITIWGTIDPLPTVAGNSQVVVTKNRVYLIGGKDNSGYRNTVYYALINTDGSLGSWVTDTVFPIAIAESQSVVTKNKVYLIGGRNSSGYLNVIYVAVINADGSLGAWTKHAEYVYTTALSGSGTFNISAGITNVTIHGLGGPGTTTYNPGQPYIAPTYKIVWGDYNGNGGVDWEYYNYDPGLPFTSGILPDLPPVPATAGVEYIGPRVVMYVNPESVVYSVARRHVISKNDVMLSPGQPYIAPSNSYTTGASTTITVDGVTYTSPGGYGGAASQTTNNLTFSGTNSIPVSYNIASGGSGDISYWGGNYLPYTIGSSNIIVTRNRVYSIGGYVNGSVSSAVYSAPIDSEGVIGAWVADTSLPAAVAYSSIVVTNNRVYILGGSTNGTNSVNTVYTATINTVTGIIGSWVASTNLLTAVCKASVFTTKNKVYLIGGNTATNTAGSLVQMCTINADGTLGTWSVGTTIPGVLSESGLAITKNHIYLLNGSTGSTYTNTNYMAAVSDSLNDYSPYYDGTILPLDINYESSLFALPDFTNKEKNGVNFYIKF